MVSTIIGINKEVSEELGIPQDIVKKVNKFFWEKGIKDAIRSGDYTNIRIRGLGTISSSRRKIWKEISYIIATIRNMRNNDAKFKNKSRDEVIEELKLELRKLLIRRDELAKAFYIKQIRFKQRINEYYNKDLEREEDNLECIQE